MTAKKATAYTTQKLQAALKKALPTPAPRPVPAVADIQNSLDLLNSEIAEITASFTALEQRLESVSRGEDVCLPAVNLPVGSTALSSSILGSTERLNSLRHSIDRCLFNIEL